MSPKKAIITLTIILIICGSFFAYLFRAKRIIFLPEKKETGEAEAIQTPKDRAQQVLDLAARLDNMPIGSSTPAERAEKVMDLAESANSLDIGTSTKEQRARAVSDLSQHINNINQE